MSVDSTELRKSTLQRKDREELTAIATALGAKPSSRARKAEIVDLILETVGDDAEPQADGPDAGDDHADDHADDRDDGQEADDAGADHEEAAGNERT
ncbi:MAG: hypothetical protein OES57_17600, partial [Acidimicrobiia bacterium]|nr:hypothetical protein [Acidimicrobiia bacterium]